MLPEIIILLLSLLGIACGYVLSFIAAEELMTGKKYFLFLQRVLFVAGLIFVDYQFFILKEYLLVGGVLVIGLFLLVLMIWQKEMRILWVISLLVFILSYFALPNFFFSGIETSLVIAVLIFLYGLPTGTLLRKINQDEK